MKPYNKYPTTIERKGYTYKLNLSFKAVLLCLDIFKDTQLEDTEKIMLVMDILIKDEHEYDYKLLDEILYLIKPNKQSTKKEKVIDIEKDFELIVAAFRQAYGINLVESNMHYLEFITLLNGLPSGTRLADVIQIRTMPVPKPGERSPEDIAEILRLKAEYTLNDEDTYQEGIGMLFNALKRRIE